MKDLLTHGGVLILWPYLSLVCLLEIEENLFQVDLDMLSTLSFTAATWTRSARSPAVALNPAAAEEGEGEEECVQTEEWSVNV